MQTEYLVELIKQFEVWMSDPITTFLVLVGFGSLYYLALAVASYLYFFV